MATQQNINFGAYVGDPTADKTYAGFEKTQANFSTLFLNPASQVYYFDQVTPAPDKTGVLPCNASWAALIAQAPTNVPVTVHLNPAARYNFTGGGITVPANWNVICDGFPLYNNLNPLTCPGLILAAGPMLYSNPLQTTGAMSIIGPGLIKGVTVISQYVATTTPPTTLVGVEAYVNSIYNTGTGFQTLPSGADVTFEDCAAVGFRNGYVADSGTGLSTGGGSSPRTKWFRCRSIDCIYDFYWANTNDAGWMANCEARSMISYGNQIPANSFLAFGSPVTDGAGGTLLPVTAYNGVSASPWSNLLTSIGQPAQGSTVTLTLEHITGDPTNGANTPSNSNPSSIGAVGINNVFTPPYVGASPKTVSATNKITGVWMAHGGGWAVQVPGILPTAFYYLGVSNDGNIDVTTNAVAPNCAQLARVASHEGIGYSFYAQGETVVNTISGFGKETLVYNNSPSTKLLSVTSDGGTEHNLNSCCIFLDQLASNTLITGSTVLNYQTGIYNAVQYNSAGLPIMITTSKFGAQTAAILSPGYSGGGAPISFVGCSFGANGDIGIGTHSGVIGFSGCVFANSSGVTVWAQSTSQVLFDAACQNLGNIITSATLGSLTGTQLQALNALAILNLAFSLLPTTVPGSPGILWNNAGVVSISGSY